MNSKPVNDPRSWWKKKIFSSSSSLSSLILLLLFFLQNCLHFSTALTPDGVLLLSLKHSVVSDPLSILQTWNYLDETPCSWLGITCGGDSIPNSDYIRVTGISLPDSQLLGTIPPDLGLIQHLRSLNLSRNSLNGSIPPLLFNATELRVLDLSDNLLDGELSELVGTLNGLEFLNLSDNAIGGTIPLNLSSLGDLTVVSLKSNYFSGSLQGEFNKVRVLDLSSNLINGSLPSDFGGNELQYLNVSYNRISGEIPPEFTHYIPENATLDLSFNNLTGEIPESSVFTNQNTESFSGNTDLCGKPLRSPCPKPTSALPPNASETTSPPAIAAIPKSLNKSPPDGDQTMSPVGPQRPHEERHPNKSRKGGIKAVTIAEIVAADLAGIIILASVFAFLYRIKKKRNKKRKSVPKTSAAVGDDDWISSDSSESKRITKWSCLRKKSVSGDDESTSVEEDEQDQTISDVENLNENKNGAVSAAAAAAAQGQRRTDTGMLVTVDGGNELELETLLKASAFILGASGSNIVYKAVLEDGTALAVRRIGETGLERLKDFENQIRSVAKFVHPNIVRVRGFYWGTDEKLLIYEFVPNGSLANARYRKAGSSPCHMPWEIRLKIAKGVARGLNYLHEKKQVHGNLKPSNVLLDIDMDPKIADFGLERLATGESGYKPGGSIRHFGSKRSTASRDSFQDFSLGATPSPSASSIGCVSPYHPPESLRSLKPNQKWDVYSFGVLLLELITGKVTVSDDMMIPAIAGSTSEDKIWVLRMADVAIRADLEGKEDILLACLKLGYSCVSSVPLKRPPMKEVVQMLEKIPASACSSPYVYGP